MSTPSDIPAGSPQPGQVYKTHDGEARHVTLIAETPAGLRVRWRSGEPESGLRYGQASMAEWMSWIEANKAELVVPSAPAPRRRSQRRRIPLTVEADQYRLIANLARTSGVNPVDWVRDLVQRELDAQQS